MAQDSKSSFYTNYSRKRNTYPLFGQEKKEGESPTHKNIVRINKI